MFGRPTPIDFDSKRPRAIPDGVKTIPNDFGNAGRTYIPVTVPKLSESDRSRHQIFAHLYPSLPQCTSDVLQTCHTPVQSERRQGTINVVSIT